jgi:hypothetical protein
MNQLRPAGRGRKTAEPRIIGSSGDPATGVSTRRPRFLHGGLSLQDVKDLASEVQGRYTSGMFRGIECHEADVGQGRLRVERVGANSLDGHEATVRHS